MNLPVLIKYISHTLHTFVRICSPDGQIQCAVCDVGGLEDTLIKQPDVYDFLLHRENTDLPIIKESMIRLLMYNSSLTTTAF